MSILRENALPLLRHPAAYEDYVRPGDDQLLNDAVNTLYGIGDLKLVENAMIDRYAQYLVRGTSTDTGVVTTALLSGAINIKTDTATEAAIQAGQYEFNRLEWFNSVAGATATLFSEPGLRYEYDDTKAADNMPEIREDGGANLTAQRWDAVACAVKSCALYLVVRGGQLIETEVRPTSIWIVFADMITDGDSVRSTNKNNIDEASVVVMARGSGGNQYAAWFGPCALYPNGRHVTYESKIWNDIPQPGTSKTAQEYTTDGDYSTTGFGLDQLANPLTLWSVNQKSNSLPVYPFAILYGDPQSVGLMPTSTSLYETGLEYDLCSSMILASAGKGARGMRVFTRGQGGSQDIPSTTDEALVVVDAPSALVQAGWSPTHAKAAMEVLSDIARKKAEANHVPGYLTLANDTAQPPSGRAVMMLNEDRIDHRRKRIELNRGVVRRRWEIEKALINLTVGKVTISEEATETWNPGEVEFMQDPTEKAAEWEARIKLGEASMLDVIRDMRGFTSDSDALEWAEQRKELLEDETNAAVLDFFKPAAAAPAPKGGGLFGGRG